MHEWVRTRQARLELQVTVFDSSINTSLYGYILGSTIAQLREKKGWTQGELGRMVGMTQSSISRIEKGQSSPDANQVRVIARAFGMSATDFTSIVEDAEARAEQATESQDVPKEKPNATLALLGAVGLAGLAGFAAAMALRAKASNNHDGEVTEGDQESS